MIELKQVTKEYGRAAVLKNITLTLEEPGIYCLLSYVFLAACISLANTFIHLVIDPLYPARRVINLMDVCGWTGNGLGPARGCSPSATPFPSQRPATAGICSRALLLACGFRLMEETTHTTRYVCRFETQNWRE